MLKKDRSKIQQLGILANYLNNAFIGITETWLDESVECGEILIENFSIYRADRKGRKRGGACLYIRSDIPVAPLLTFSNGMVESVIVKVPVWDAIIGVIYRPPDTSCEKWQEAISIIDEIITECQCDEKFQNIILEGEFNFADADWNNVSDE